MNGVVEAKHLLGLGFAFGTTFTTLTVILLTFLFKTKTSELVEYVPIRKELPNRNCTSCNGIGKVQREIGWDYCDCVNNYGKA